MTWSSLIAVLESCDEVILAEHVKAYVSIESHQKGDCECGYSLLTIAAVSSHRFKHALVSAMFGTSPYIILLLGLGILALLSSTVDH